MSSMLCAGAIAFGQGCGAPSVGSFNKSGDFEINDAETKPKESNKPNKSSNKPGKGDTDDESGGTQTPDETETQTPTPSPQTDPCLSCLSGQSPAAAQYALCASQCPASATDPTCDNNCWNTKGCAAQEDQCGAALNACDATCR